MNHFLIYGVVAERGGWKVIAKDVRNDYVVLGTAEDIQPEMGRAYNSILKNKFVSDDEKVGAEIVLENLQVLISIAPKISEQIVEGNFDEAAILYKRTGYAAYDAALLNAQSGVATVQRRLSKTLLLLRVAK